METIIHKADTRGKANHGWLNTHHTFSFGSYYDPARIHFGTLRVLNDDIVSAGNGFGMHPHDNMEIVSIPLHGTLEHRDNMGHTQIIRTNEIQIMSAGNGVMHSELNHSKEEDVNFLQIWVVPKVRDVKPRYQKKVFDPQDRANKIQTVVSPDGDNALQINQDAYFSLGNFEPDYETQYKLRSDENGVYVFIIEGQAEVAGEQLEKRDGIGVWDTENLNIKALDKTEILLIEIPMIGR